MSTPTLDPVHRPRFTGRHRCGGALEQQANGRIMRPLSAYSGGRVAAGNKQHYAVICRQSGGRCARRQRHPAG